MKLGEILIEQGHADDMAIQKALSVQATTGRRIGEILVEAGVIAEDVLEEALVFQKNIENDPSGNKHAFLEDVVPFSSLSKAEVKDIVDTMSWRSFPPGETIIRQGAPGEKFYLVKGGLVKVSLVEEGKETVLGFLGEGDCFGEISLLTNGPATATIQTIEHTLCLTQNKEDFVRMTQKFPLFHKFFNQLLSQRLRAVYRELLSENPGIGQVEPYLYRKQVREMLAPSQPFYGSGMTIHETTQRIVEGGGGTVIVVDDQRRPKGILGTTKILRSVLLEGANPQQPIESIMERHFHSIESKSYFFDAVHEMVKRKTNTLVVMEGERVEGLLTGFDLLRFRGREVLSLLRNIEGAPDISQLNVMRQEVEKVLKALMTDGALASQACKIVSEFNDKMVRRVIGLTEVELGLPPVPYAWLGLGSEGRKEQTLLTDQDNALIFASPPTGKTEAYLKQFATKVVDGLNRCGFPLCKGGVMANQPKWFGDLDQWRARVGDWVRVSMHRGENVSDIFSFLDFRSVSGDSRLEKELRSHVFALIREHPVFLKSLAQDVIDIPVPLGFFKHFIVEKSGKYKSRINLKISGLVPLITCVKVLALQQGVGETNTLERIKALIAGKAISSDQGEFLEQAFETFLTLKIRNNLSEIEEGKEYGSHFDPAELSTRQKQLLKEAFLAVSQIQKTTRSLLKIESQQLGLMG